MRLRAIVSLSFILIFFFHAGVSKAYGNIPPKEREALIALYNSTGGDNWENNSGWKDAPLHTDGFAMPGTEKDWYGITCDSGNTMVLGIDFEFNKLTGIIPPELCNLSSLYMLNLGYNQLTGGIPPELGELGDLETLELLENPLTGNIPPELSKLSNLRKLNLSSNQLTGSILPELGDLSKLDTLKLADRKSVV